MWNRIRFMTIQQHVMMILPRRQQQRQSLPTIRFLLQMMSILQRRAMSGVPLILLERIGMKMQMSMDGQKAVRTKVIMI